MKKDKVVKSTYSEKGADANAGGKSLHQLEKDFHEGIQKETDKYLIESRYSSKKPKYL
jgi:hypothetical protein